MPKGYGYDTPPKKAAAFKLKSGNATPFKMMGSSPIKDDTTTYTVKKGDWLSTIAKEHGIKGGWEAIHKLNPDIKNPDLIHPGQKIKIPGKSNKGEQTITTRISPEYTTTTPSYRGSLRLPIQPEF